jgi:hypothetical protein
LAMSYNPLGPTEAKAPFAWESLIRQCSFVLR